MEQNILALKKEKIYQDLWSLAWPVMISMVLHTTLGLVDMYWVGKLGTTAVASLALAGNLFWMFITFSEIISIGTVALVARFKGAQEDKALCQVVYHSFWLALWISLVLAVLVFSFARPLISLFRVEAALHTQAVGYLRITGLGFIFIYAGMSFSSALQGVGDTRTPMIIMVAVNLLNIILDPIFIFGWLGFPALGVLGAGLATLLSQAVSFFLLLYIITRGRVSPSGLKVNGLFTRAFSFEYFRNILKVGLPASLQASTRPLTGLFMMWIVALFGTEAMAAFGIGQRILGFSFILLVGLMVATSTMVGQSLGAKKKELSREVARRAMLVGLIIQLFASIFYFFLAAPIMSFFGAEGATLAIGVSYMRIISLALLLAGPLFVLEGVFKGAGDTIPPMISAVVANWLIKLPCAYILSIPFNLGPDGVWWAISLSIIAELIFLGFYYQRGSWLEKDISLRAP